MSREKLYEAAAKAIEPFGLSPYALRNIAEAAVDAVLAEMEAITTIKVESVSWIWREEE